MEGIKSRRWINPAQEEHNEYIDWNEHNHRIIVERGGHHQDLDIETFALLFTPQVKAQS
jgi:hypothetical protein